MTGSDVSIAGVKIIALRDVIMNHIFIHAVREPRCGS